MENSKSIPQENDEYTKPTMQELIDYIHTDWREPSPYTNIDVSWFVSNAEKKYGVIDYKLNGENVAHQLIKEVLIKKPQIVKLYIEYAACIDGFPALEKKLAHFTEEEQEDFLGKLSHALRLFIYRTICDWGVEAHDKHLDGSPSSSPFLCDIFLNFIKEVIDRKLIISGNGI